MKRSSFVLLVWMAAALPAQSPLATLFASNNQGAPGGMVYFDVDVQAAAGVTVTRLDLNLALSGDEVEVYVTQGGYVGNEADPSVWTLAGRGPVVFAGVDQPSAVCLGPGFVLPLGVHGFAVRGDGAVHRYTSSATPQVFGNADLQLTAGAASNQPFGGAQYAPRIWNGALHYSVGPGGVGACGWTERLGAGCYAGATTFYEQFESLAAVDLSGSAPQPLVLEAVAAGPLGYVVTSGPPQWVAPQGSPVLDNQGGVLGDDDVSEALALPFSFAFPGGSTSVIHATANGEVYLGATSQLTADVTPNGFELAAHQPRIAALWCDLEPLANLATSPTSGVYFAVAASGIEAYVTWSDVADGRGGSPLSGSTSVSVQCVLRSDGSFALRYAGIAPGPGTGRAVVGFGAGGAAPDPGTRDLSQGLPFATTGPDSYPLEHRCSPPSLGGAMSLEVQGVEAAGFAFVVLGDVPLPAGVDLAAAGAPGCRAYTNAVASVVVPISQPVGAGASLLQVPSAPALLGASYVSQAVAPGSGNALTLTTSNGVRWIIGS